MEQGSIGIGVILLAIVVSGFLILLVYDLAQKRHAVLRNYPVVGHMRYILEDLGIYLRQYFYAGDRDDVSNDRHAECQGHTCLYAAFTRSLGIPTRLVNWLVYSAELLPRVGL